MLLLLLLLLLLLSLLLPQKHLLHLSLSRGGVLGCEPGADAAVAELLALFMSRTP